MGACLRGCHNNLQYWIQMGACGPWFCAPSEVHVPNRFGRMRSGDAERNEEAKRSDATTPWGSRTITHIVHIAKPSRETVEVAALLRRTALWV